MNETYFLGARLFYWFYLLITIAGLGFVIAYTQRERLKKKWYEVRFPERLIICSLIYPGNMIRDFPMLIPDAPSFTLQGGTYLFTDKAILKNNSWYAREAEGGKLKVVIDGKDYFIDIFKALKYRWEKWPHIYYKVGFPYPIDWNKEQKTPELAYSSQELDAFGSSTILKQIYAELQGSGIWIALLILILLVAAISGYTALKVSGVLK